MEIELKKTLGLLLVLFGLLPIMPNSLTGVLPILLFAVGLIHFIRKPRIKADWKSFFLNASLFMSYGITFLYSEDIAYAFRKIGPYTWSLIFPLIFFVLLAAIEIESKTMRSFIRLFNLSSILYATICLVYVFSAYDNGALQLHIPPIYEIRGALEQLPIIGRHPIYTALFTGISILFLANQLLSEPEKSRSSRFSSIFFLLYLCSFLILIQAKAAIFFLIPSLTILILQHQKNRFNAFAVVFSLAFAIGVLIFLMPRSYNRFGELFDPRTYKSETIDQYNSSQIRLEIWRSSVENIKESPLFGHGLGDVQSKLNQTYAERSSVLAKESYNSHNQYLGIWLVAGIPGIVIFVFFLYNNCTAFWKLRHQKSEFMATFAILIFFILNFMTENILDRQLGALSFFFLINFFGAMKKFEGRDEGNEI